MRIPFWPEETSLLKEVEWREGSQVLPHSLAGPARSCVIQKLQLPCQRCSFKDALSRLPDPAFVIG